jgi:hypothetical protein
VLRPRPAPSTRPQRSCGRDQRAEVRGRPSQALRPELASPVHPSSAPDLASREPVRKHRPGRCACSGLHATADARASAAHTHAPGPTSPPATLPGTMAGPASRSRLASRFHKNGGQRTDDGPDDPPPASPSQLAVPDARRRAQRLFCSLFSVLCLLASAPGGPGPS